MGLDNGRPHVLIEFTWKDRTTSWGLTRPTEQTQVEGQDYIMGLDKANRADTSGRTGLHYGAWQGQQSRYKWKDRTTSWGLTRPTEQIQVEGQDYIMGLDKANRADTSGGRGLHHGVWQGKQSRYKWKDRTTSWGLTKTHGAELRKLILAHYTHWHTAILAQIAESQFIHHLSFISKAPDHLFLSNTLKIYLGCCQDHRDLCTLWEWCRQMSRDGIWGQIHLHCTPADTNTAISCMHYSLPLQKALFHYHNFTHMAWSREPYTIINHRIIVDLYQKQCFYSPTFPTMLDLMLYVGGAFSVRATTKVNTHIFGPGKSHNIRWG